MPKKVRVRHTCGHTSEIQPVPNQPAAMTERRVARQAKRICLRCSLNDKATRIRYPMKAIVEL